MNNERPTPETDAASMSWYGNKDAVQGDFARKLERERDEARSLLAQYSAEREHNAMQALAHKADADSMRDAIKEAHGAISQCLKYMLKLPLSGSDAECEVMDDAHHALRKLQPFLND